MIKNNNKKAKGYFITDLNKSIIAIPLNEFNLKNKSEIKIKNIGKTIKFFFTTFFFI